MSAPSRRDVSVVWSVWFPLLIVGLLLVLGLFFPRGYSALTYKEGPIEWLTVVVALTGAVVAVVAFRRRAALPRTLRWLPLVLVLGQVYIAGEESSWGQHIFNPRLPGEAETVKNRGVANVDPRAKEAAVGEERDEALQQLHWVKRINYQGETNLHNLPSFWGKLFGKWPKQMVEFGSLIGCVIVPLFLARRLKLDDPANPTYWLWPTTATATAAIIAFLLPWPKRVMELLFEGEAHVFLRLSEPQELFLAIVIALYTASLVARLPRPTGHAQTA